MAEIGLGEYCDEVKESIKAQSIDEAIAICRHILEWFPKYSMPYRLLGETALERDEYDEAASLFTRVLGADPEDVIAHVGLAVVHDEKKELEEAIWHLERAFELAPGNTEIRQELKRLYGEGEGVEPPRVKLTPAALAHLYLREGLYDRAITELRPLLKEDPDRVDLKVALAEALWREGRRREAAEACQEILKLLPNCLKANLILGLIWKESGQEEEGETLLAQAQAIDPENEAAQELFGEASPLPLEKVLLPRLEEIPTPPPAPEVEAVALPTEMAPPPKPEEAVEEMAEEEMPEWLRRLHEVAAEEVEAKELAPEIEEKLPLEGGPEAAPPREEVPDWLRELKELPEAAPVEEVEEAIAPPTPWEEMPEWLRGLEELPEEVSEEAEWEEAPPLAEEEVELTEVLPAQPIEEEVTIEEAPPIVEEIIEEAPTQMIEEAPPIAEEIVEEIPTVIIEAAPPIAEEMEEAPTQIIEEAPPTMEGYLDRLAAEPGDHEARLGLARAYLAQGERDEALTHYRTIIHSEATLIGEVIKDLEAAAQEAPEHLPTQQLLGDAYMKSGRLDEALEKYRWLRERLKT
jgi:tetratricopeptide (TPR) repeat protein